MMYFDWCNCCLQVVAAVAMSKVLQNNFKPLLGMSVAALEPQLDSCRCVTLYAQKARISRPYHAFIAWQKRTICYLASIAGESQCKLLTCRPQDLCILASELCNLGLHVKHAALVRTAVEAAISTCRTIPARELASLAHACGTLRNITKDQMLVKQPLCCSLMSHLPADCS